MWQNLTAAVSCARDLRLVNSGSLQHSDVNEEEQNLAERSVWFLYLMETGYAIHKGMLPVSYPSSQVPS